MSVFIINKLQHHFNILTHSLVGGVFACSINHALGDIVNHLEVGFHFLVGGWVDVGLDYKLVAVLATLLTLCG